MMIFNEWYLLLKEAQEIGLTPEEIKKWLDEQMQQNEIAWSMKQEA